jgi:hypothetical protein
MPPLRKTDFFWARLEREVQTHPGQTEVVMRPFQNVPAHVSGHTNVAGNTNFQTTTELTGKTILAPQIIETAGPFLKTKILTRGLVIAAVEITTQTAPRIR